MKAALSLFPPINSESTLGEFMHYYSFHVADWALHTSHLSLEEEAIYFRLLNYYYDTEKPIPKDLGPVIRRCRMSGHEDALNLILSEYFTLEDDGYHNSRADTEISEYHKKSETARVNGKKGGRPKNTGLKTQSVILANPEKTGSKANHKPVTNNQEPRTKFIKPTPEQVRSYGQSINFDIDAEKFVAYYDSNGWMVGKNKMRDWKAAVVTWKRNQRDAKSKAQPNHQPAVLEMREI